MPKLKITFLLLLAMTSLGFSSSSVYAQTEFYKAPPSTPIDNTSQKSGTFGNFEVGLPGIDIKTETIDSFVGGKDSKPILKFINLAVNTVIAVLVIIGLISIVIGGYIYMTAGGDAGQVKTAKEWILAALVGIFLSLISVIILNTVNKYIGSGAEEPKLGESSEASGTGDSNGGGGSGSGNNTNGGAQALPDGGNGQPSQNNGESSADGGGNDSGSNGSSGGGSSAGQITDKPPFVRVLLDKGQYYVADAKGANYKPATLDEIMTLANGTATTGDNGIRVKIFQTENPGTPASMMGALRSKLSTGGFTNDQIYGP